MACSWRSGTPGGADMQPQDVGLLFPLQLPKGILSEGWTWGFPLPPPTSLLVETLQQETQGSYNLRLWQRWVMRGRKK